MGLFVSLISNIINLQQKIREEQAREAREERRELFEKAQNPITPPDFYASIAERDIHVPTGAYSTKTIKEDLNNDVIPTGYALQQLSDTGFKPEVDAYNIREDGRNKDLKTGLITELNTIIDQIHDSLISTESAELQKEAAIYKRQGFDKLITQAKSIIADIKIDKASSQNVNAFITKLQSKLDIVNVVLKKDQLAASRIQAVGEAQDQKDAIIRGAIQKSLLYDIVHEGDKV